MIRTNYCILLHPDDYAPETVEATRRAHEEQRQEHWRKSQLLLKDKPEPNIEEVVDTEPHTLEPVIEEIIDEEPATQTEKPNITEATEPKTEAERGVKRKEESESEPPNAKRQKLVYTRRSTKSKFVFKSAEPEIEEPMIGALHNLDE